MLAPESLRLHLLSGENRHVVRELVDGLDGRDDTLATAGLEAGRSPYHVEVWVARPVETNGKRAAEAAPQEAAGQAASARHTPGSQLAIKMFAAHAEFSLYLWILPCALRMNPSPRRAANATGFSARCFALHQVRGPVTRQCLHAELQGACP